MLWWWRWLDDKPKVHSVGSFFFHKTIVENTLFEDGDDANTFHTSDIIQLEKFI